MLRKFALFFITFGLSFAVEAFGWTDQGTAFLWIDIGSTIILDIFIILICLFEGDGIGEKLGLSLIVAFRFAISLGICLFATWLATKLFPVDFKIAFQIMSFGQCLCFNRPSKSDDD